MPAAPVPTQYPVLRQLKRPALILAGLLIIYALAGFILLPAIARSQAVDILKERYRLDLEIGKLRFNPFTFSARLEGVSLSDPGGERLLAFAAFGADFELRSLIDRALVFKSVTLSRPYVHIHLREDGTVNLARAFASPPGETADDGPASAPPALIIGDIALNGGDLHFTDNSQGRDFDQHFTPLDLHVQRFSTRPEDRSDLVGLNISIGESGRLTVSGDLSAIPTRFDIQLAARGIPLAIFQPYLEDRLPARISDGSLDFDLSLAQGEPGQTSRLKLSGKAAIRGLAVKLKERDDVALAWEEVAANGMTLDLSPDRLAIGEIAIRGLDTSFKIYADGRTNVSEMARQARGESPESAAMAPEEPAAAGTDSTTSGFPYAIDRVVVAGSHLMFSDTQIQPNVRIRIEDLAGEIRGIASAPEAQTTIALTGRVGEYGKAKIDGAARLAAPRQDLKARVTFDNVELTSFSPYAGKFAGYTIDKGKLFLDLDYTLAGSRIRGENHAVFDQFELGDRVDSADALKLPIKFALSLLRDREGRIDIDLPVEGDVDAPGFRLGPLVVKALVNLVTRIVTAPFDFIAGMFVGGPEMEYAVFAPGDGALPGAEREKILPLSRALAERPRLVVEVQGWADPGADAVALRQGKFDALLAAAGPPTDAALVTAYDGFFGAGAVAALRTELAAGARSDPAAEPAGEMPADPEAAFRAELSNRLLAAQPVTDEELAALAYARGEQVMGLLVQDGGVEAERVFVRRGEIARDGEGTRAKLILDAR
ncbi:MAG: DUF748 domain-containing protein [Gammaproteobacteria bacterium]|nr:DUF748 domain-containing protein [Gammaproteobacteria bacterium]